VDPVGLLQRSWQPANEP